jgi:hypothetical protein
VRLLYVPVQPDTLDRLREIARRERRRPQDQAALILERALDSLESTDPPSHEQSALSGRSATS